MNGDGAAAEGPVASTPISIPAATSTNERRFSRQLWELDKRTRFECAPLTAAFHRAVPALRYLNWTIERVEQGLAITRLPLSVESSNQYITQQAALMLLAADYTGGIALSTLFSGTPVVGFHPQKDDRGAYMWGAAASIKWLRPSTQDIVCRASIPEKAWEDIASTFESGEEVRRKVRIKLYNDERLVAVSDFDYWARNSHSLRSTGHSLASTHHMLTHKLNTAAKLIAALRSWIRMPDGEALDPFAAKAACAQGAAMARKFSLDAPQLADLVKARTLCCDDALRDFSRTHARFLVINIGCGYDARPWRMRDLGNATFVELDLPVMLKEREQALPHPSDSPYQIYRVPFDIYTNSIAEAIARAALPADLPKFIIWEGGSMYFERSDGNTFLSQIRQVMSTACRLWFDFVTCAAVEGSTGLPEVERFMHSMRVIGEPFVRGFSDLSSELGTLCLAPRVSWLAADLLGSADPVCRQYGFALCSPTE